MTCADLVETEPANGATAVPLDTLLGLTFASATDFRQTPNARISLYEVSDESTAVWQSDPGPEHPDQGSNQVTFGDVPKLKPNTHYFVLWDPGWVRVGGKPVRALNDGAFWWRFRTAP